MSRGWLPSSQEARQTRELYRELLRSVVVDAEVAAASRLDHHQKKVAQFEFQRAIRKATEAPVSELRPRLLVANQELYSEYDRLAAEASFRLNVSAPLAVLSVLAVVRGAPLLGVGVLVAAVLLYQSIVREAAAASVLQRAVLQGVIVHPARTALEQASKN